MEANITVPVLQLYAMGFRLLSRGKASSYGIFCRMSASPMTLQHMYSLDESTINGYRLQRKRRAGISGGSAVMPRAGAAFACAGGNGYSSAGVSGGKGFPLLGGRSPQSSFDSNQDVAQISMNWMRMNGLGQSVRPLLTGNHTPKNSQSTSHIPRIGSLRRMQIAGDADLDGKLSRSGTQADVALFVNIRGSVDLPN
ncbi:unnamed protein product [Caenorhabditis auriculariae]|uniref:Uncharacterized protein n=1 Tax=Caenorhabditis auriculariae TaxID=2777116 RepID=A0A8S1HRD7_9PELO|nr:unnamed protein product [Caenorhabditis auriculariae]